MREEGRGSREASRHTSWINKSNQWLCPHLKVLGRLKHKCLKSWNICQQGWANTVRITTQESSAAVGPKRLLSDSNCCFLEITIPSCWTLSPCYLCEAKALRNHRQVHFSICFSPSNEWKNSWITHSGKLYFAITALLYNKNILYESNTKKCDLTWRYTDDAPQATF